MLIAIDHGNYAIKTPNYSFVSGLSEHTVKPPLTDEILEYDGRYWTLSGKRLSYMRDKTQDERYFVLSLFAIAKELQSYGNYAPIEQIDLAVGLPPEHYGVLKDKFAHYFKRDGVIKFVYQDRPYNIIINRVMVFPQAYAAVVPQSSLVVNTINDLEKGIIGWDMGLLVNLARASQACGHITKEKAWDYIEQADKLCSLDLHTAEEIDKSFLLGKAMKSEKIEDWDRLLLCYSLLGKYRK